MWFWKNLSTLERCCPVKSSGFVMVSFTSSQSLNTLRCQSVASWASSTTPPLKTCQQCFPISLTLAKHCIAPVLTSPSCSLHQSLLDFTPGLFQSKTQALLLGQHLKTVQNALYSWTVSHKPHAGFIRCWRAQSCLAVSSDTSASQGHHQCPQQKTMKLLKQGG